MADKSPTGKEYIKTGIKGLDEMFDEGIPKGSSILIAGGAGAGKTILCLQIMANALKRGKKCLYMSFEESEERLEQHMKDFGWNAKVYKKQNKLLLKRFDLFDISRSVEALLSKKKKEVRIEIEPVILPKDFNPDFITVDSLTAIASAFVGKEQNYRTYIEQLFRFFEKTRSTSLLITETEDVPKVYSPTGVEEFLADGVIVLFNIKKGNIREKSLEILKMRGSSHIHKTVPMRIQKGVGIEIFPSKSVLEAK